MSAFLFLVWVFWCCSSWSNSTNSCWHSLQEGTGQSFMWAVKSWMFSFSPWQRGHLKRSAWQVLWWRWSESFRLNDFPHSGQVWTVSPCLVLWCRSKSTALLKLTLQMEQTRFPSMLTSVVAGGELKPWWKWGSIYSGPNLNSLTKSKMSHQVVLTLVGHCQVWRHKGISLVSRFGPNSSPDPSCTM